MNARFREKLFVCPYEVLTTLTTYSHFFADSKRRASNIIADIIEGKTANKRYKGDTFLRLSSAYRRKGAVDI